MVKKGFKYFIGCKDDKEVRPLCKLLPKMSAYRRDFDETKYMPLLIKDDKLIENSVSNSINEGFDSEPVYNEKYLKTKLKYYEGKINTNFHSDRIPKDGSQCIWLSVILIDSIYRTSKKNQVLLFIIKYF